MLESYEGQPRFGCILDLATCHVSEGQAVINQVKKVVDYR
jgi:hypothetical protein